MISEKLIQLLNKDISNEYKHMNFYLYSSMIIQGLHREEYMEFLSKEASSEMSHIQEFGKMILGLGAELQIDYSIVNSFPKNLTDPYDILNYALQIENEVVSNYVERISQTTEETDLVNAKYIELFLEDQIMASRGDADNLKQIIGFLPKTS